VTFRAPVRAPAPQRLPRPHAERERDESPVFAPPYAKVCLDRAATGFENELTYGVPPTLRADLQVGSAVLVPFGRGTHAAYVIELTPSLDFPSAQLRPLEKLLAPEPALDEAALRVARWMSAYYHCPLWECLSCWVPHGWQVKGAASRRRYALPVESQNGVLRLLRDTIRSPRRTKVIETLAKAARPMT
jgi:primosomal protein N'